MDVVTVAGNGTDVDRGLLLRTAPSYHDRPPRRKENRTGWPGIGRIWSANASQQRCLYRDRAIRGILLLNT